MQGQQVQSLYETYGTDKQLETSQGVWLDFGPAKFHVKRAGGGNKKYQTLLRQLTQPVRRLIANETIDPEKLDLIFMQAYARAVVLDWQNVTDRQGNPLEYNETNFIRVMTDLKDLWVALQAECDRMANFRQTQNAEDGEALGNSSSGTSNGEARLTT